MRNSAAPFLFRVGKCFIFRERADACAGIRLRKHFVEKGESMHWFTVLVGLLVCLGSAPAALSQEPPDHAGNKTIPPVKITKVIVDNDAGTLCIVGENFARRDFIAVELGGDPVALDLIGVSDTKIVAMIPGVIESGTYLLEVITAVPPNAGATDDIDVYIPE